MEASFYRHDWLHHWPLVSGSMSSPLPLWWNGVCGEVVDWKFPPSILFLVGSLGNGPPSLGVSKRHLSNINSTVVERDLLRITRHPFHLYVSEVTSRTEDKNKYANKRCSHWSYRSGNSKDFRSSVPDTEQDQWYISYDKLQFHSRAKRKRQRMVGTPGAAMVGGGTLINPWLERAKGGSSYRNLERALACDRRIQSPGKEILHLSLSFSSLLSFHSYHWSTPAEDRAQDGPDDAVWTGQPPSASTGGWRAVSLQLPRVTCYMLDQVWEVATPLSLRLSIFSLGLWDQLESCDDDNLLLYQGKVRHLKQTLERKVINTLPRLMASSFVSFHLFIGSWATSLFIWIPHCGFASKLSKRDISWMDWSVSIQ